MQSGGTLGFRGGGMKRYVLEVRAEFEFFGAPGRRASQLAKDITHRILDVYYLKSDEEQVICENTSASPLFHRLYTNLVDKDNTLAKKVEELRKDYSPQRASFSLSPQTDSLV